MQNHRWPLWVVDRNLADTPTLPQIIDETMATMPLGKVGIAVSGGGDSVALLLLLADWAAKCDRQIYVATVNHNLRLEAKSETAFVADVCVRLDVKCDVLQWDDWGGQGNLQNAARLARKDLLTHWAQTLGLNAVALGHTLDDQAETVLMRLARGSGVDGLSGMKRNTGNNPTWIRPLLNILRSDLRKYLCAQNQEWKEDPSNEDLTFDRIKVRKTLPALADFGLSVKRLATSADGLQLSRAALEHYTMNALQQTCLPDQYGAVTINTDALQIEPLEIQYRVLSHTMGWVTGATYRPRFLSLKAIYQRLLDGYSQTLAGCYFKADTRNNTIIVMREQAKMQTTSAVSCIYDHRWQISADAPAPNCQIAPLGEMGITQIENWQNTVIRRDVLMQMPVIWCDNRVVYTPLQKTHGKYSIKLKFDSEQFFVITDSH